MPWVTIIVLNWNGLADTLECLESLAGLDYPTYEVVVVDNDSTDGSVEAIRARFPQVTLIENGENLGFAGGNNVGMCYAMDQGTDYVLLLNNDTIVDPEFLTTLVKAAESDPSIGIVSPILYYYDEPHTIWCAGASIDWRRGVTHRLRAEEPDDGQDERIHEVDFVSGCALLAKSSVVKDTGLMDHEFFLYYEEADWCVRARAQGYRIVFVRAAKVWHKVSRSAGQDTPLVSYYMTRNTLRFLWKNLSGGRRLLAVFRHTVRTLRTILSLWIKHRHSKARTDATARVRGLLDFVGGRFGPLQDSQLG
ncbi:MAG: glycosyltransferase family 2 protein [Anaerolineae bacterium]|nr:glycosyltransferase family 2 protein [Anaerolineae bacterium]